VDKGEKTRQGIGPVGLMPPFGTAGDGALKPINPATTCLLSMDEVRPRVHAWFLQKCSFL